MEQWSQRRIHKFINRMEDKLVKKIALDKRAEVR